MKFISKDNLQKALQSFYEKADAAYAPKSHGTHLTLGTTSSTAFRGDYGNTAYTHSQAAHAPSNAQKNSDITKAEIEAKLTGAITSHTHSYAGSSSAGGAANSVKTNLAIKLNGGTTEGTNLFTFNGSTAKTVNITPSAIGASASGHTHNYAGSSSAGGVANSATKLATARTIALTGAANGSASFDGSGNITINTNTNIYANSGTSGTSGYVVLAKLVITGSYSNRPIEFKLIQRGKLTTCTVNITFANTDSTDPGLSSLKYWGTDYGIFMHKTATSNWLLYGTKSEGYDTITVVDCNAATQNITISYPGGFVTTKPTSNVTNASLGGTIGNSNTVGGYSIWSGTKAQYDAISSKSSTTLYFIKE